MKVTMDYIFIWAFILSFHWATHVPLIQNHSYQRSPENTKNEKKEKTRDNIMVKTRDKTNSLVP